MSAPGGTSGSPAGARPGGSPQITTRADRVRDIIALVLVLGGICLILVSHNGMQRLATQPIVVAKGQTAGAVWNKYAYIDLAGRAAAIIGVVVGIVSYVLHARRVKAARAVNPAP